MAVTFLSDGVPVTIDGRTWSFTPDMRPWSETAYVGGELIDPIYVYRTQRSVRMVTEFVARNIAQVALHAFTLDDNGDRVRMPAARALPKLLMRPGKTTTPYEFMHALVLDLMLWDRFAAVIDVSAAGVQLVRLPPDRWKFERDGLRRPTQIVQTVEGDRTSVPLGQCLWMDGYPIGCDTTPIEALCDVLAEERESSRYRRQLWEKGARMPGYLSRPPEAPAWTTAKEPGGKSARDRFKEGWAKFAAGGGREGETPILEDGMSYHELTGITPEDAQQLESRKFSIAEVSAFFHLPPPFAGLLDNANFSNVAAYREILYSDTLGPFFQQIQQAYNARLLTHPAVVGTSSAFVEFNVGEKLRLNFDQQARIFQTTTGGPIMTRNEARRRLNLPAIDGADELIVPLNVVTGGQASPTDSGSQNEGANT